MPKRYQERRHANGRSEEEREGKRERKRDRRGNSMEEREKDMRRRKLDVLRVSPAIFQAVFLQDNGFNRDLIKIIQMACPAINSIWEFPRHRKLFHALFVCFRAIYDIPINFANKSPISLVTFGRDF